LPENKSLSPIPFKRAGQKVPGLASVFIPLKIMAKKYGAFRRPVLFQEVLSVLMVSGQKRFIHVPNKIFIPMASDLIYSIA